MRIMRSAALLLVLVCASCNSATSSSTCTEYATEIHKMVAAGASSEEHVAGMIADDPDQAGPCAEAILEALFTGAFDEIEVMLDG